MKVGVTSSESIQHAEEMYHKRNSGKIMCPKIMRANSVFISQISRRKMWLNGPS